VTDYNTEGWIMAQAHYHTDHPHAVRARMLRGRVCLEAGRDWIEVEHGRAAMPRLMMAFSPRAALALAEALTLAAGEAAGKAEAP